MGRFSISFIYCGGTAQIVQFILSVCEALSIFSLEKRCVTTMAHVKSNAKAYEAVLFLETLWNVGRVAES